MRHQQQQANFFGSSSHNSHYPSLPLFVQREADLPVPIAIKPYLREPVKYYITDIFPLREEGTEPLMIEMPPWVTREIAESGS